MTDEEYQEFKKYKEILISHLSKAIPKPLILVIDNVAVKSRLDEVFKYDIQELSKFGDEELFTMKDIKLKVFKICTSNEYSNLSDVIKDNSEIILANK